MRTGGAGLGLTPVWRVGQHGGGGGMGGTQTRTLRAYMCVW